MNELQEELTDAINKSLPSQVGNALKEQLLELADLRKQKETWSKEKDILKRREVDDESQIRALREDLSAASKNVTQSQELQERERSLEISLLKKDLECQKSCAGMAMDLNLSLTRNLEYRKEVGGGIFDTVQHTDPNGMILCDNKLVPGTQNETSTVS